MIENVSPCQLFYGTVSCIHAGTESLSRLQRWYRLPVPPERLRKLYQAAENIYQEYVASQDFKGTQVVFSDIGTPTGKKGFNVYDFLKGELIKKGIPRDEIAFIHDAKNDKQKEELFADMRSGRKRILIGSTSMMGTGTNIQKRLCAAHHIDCPWKPSDIERAPVKAS